MPSRFALTLYEVSTWIIPLIVAITFHEAAHGFVAYLFGDATAWRQGRVSFNPLKHIDPFGTILLPALLMITHSGSVRLNSILPVCAPGPGSALLFLLMNCHRARQVLRPKMAYTYLP
jgi:Zn-dependent protease